MTTFARELEIKPKYMTLEEFLEVANAGKPLDTEEIHRFMDEASNEARRLTFRLNTAYHTPDEVRALLSELFGYEVPDTFRVFPPFYTDFGRNIHVAPGVFINACCHFQDHGGVTIGEGSQIGHNVVFATLNHGIEPRLRKYTQLDYTVGRHDRRQLNRGRRRRGYPQRAGKHCRGRRARKENEGYKDRRGVKKQNGSGIKGINSFMPLPLLCLSFGRHVYRFILMFSW